LAFGLLNSINNNENNLSKPERSLYRLKISLKHVQAEKTIGKRFEKSARDLKKSAWSLHLVVLKPDVLLTNKISIVL